VAPPEGEDDLRAVHVGDLVGCRAGRYHGQARDVLAGQPAQLIELVHAHVDRDPAAVRAEHRRRRPLVPLVTGDQVDDAELARGDPVMQLPQARHEPPPVGHLQRNPGRRRGLR